MPQGRRIHCPRNWRDRRPRNLQEAVLLVVLPIQESVSRNGFHRGQELTVRSVVVRLWMNAVEQYWIVTRSVLS